MRDQLDLDEFDQRITNVLFDFADGIGFNKIKTETGLHTKTLNNHLKLLVKHGIIKKDKLLPYPSAPTKYTLLIDENMRAGINSVIEATFKVVNFSHGYSKTKQYEMFPFMAQAITNIIFSSLVQYLLLPHGEVLYQILLNKLEEKLDEYKKYLDKNFSKKAKDHVYDVCITVVSPLQLAVNMVIIAEIEARVNKPRNFEEVMKQMLSYDRNLVYDRYCIILREIKQLADKIKTPKDLKEYFDSLPDDIESYLK